MMKLYIEHIGILFLAMGLCACAGPKESFREISKDKMHDKVPALGQVKWSG